MLSGVHWNIKAVVVALFTGVLVVYASYNMWNSATAENIQTKSLKGGRGTAKKPCPSTGITIPPTIMIKDLQINRSLPTDLTDKAKNAAVQIEEKRINIKIDQAEWAVFYREANGGDGVPLVLLHGAAFTSQNWVDIDTIQVAARLGHRVIAVDLPPPGRGQTTGSRAPSGDSGRGQFLEALLEALGVARPVLVSPSMSGTYALPFVLGEKYTHTPAGYIPVAPVHTEVFEDAQYEKIKIPVLIVYGSNDRSLGVSSAVHLSHFPNSVTHVIQGAGHPAYLDKPQEWTQLIYNFLMLFDKQ